MMREIKFRAWSSLRGMQSVKGLEFIRRKVSTLADTGQFWIDDFDDMELMQYTGLKDKNGVEIYEGDVIYHGEDYEGQGDSDHYRPGTAQVVSRAFGFCFEDIDCGCWRFEGPEGPMWTTSGIEVIGNIYENPELLTSFPA